MSKIVGLTFPQEKKEGGKPAPSAPTPPATPPAAGGKDKKD